MKEITFLRTIKRHRQQIGELKSPLVLADGVQITQPSSNVRLYRHNSTIGDPLLSTIYFLPGTAFVAREESFTDVICSHICANSECQVLCIKHELAPEVKFPNGHLDAYKILKKTLELTASYNVDKTKMAIVGYSSGGNFAALITAMAGKDGLNFNRQVLISPCLDLSRHCSKFKDFENQDTAITEQFVTWFLNHYVPEGTKREDPRISPVWEDIANLKKLPPTDIIVATYDRFRGDSEIYAEKLQKAAIAITKYEVPKEDHSFLWNRIDISEFIGLKIKYALATPSLSLSPENCLLSSKLIFWHPQTNKSTAGKQFVTSKNNKVITLTNKELSKLLAALFVNLPTNYSRIPYCHRN